MGDGPYPAAVRLNNRPADRQPHSHAIRLGGDERIEDLRDVAALQSRAVVGDGNLDELPRRGGANPHLPHSSPSLRQSLARVLQ